MKLYEYTAHQLHTMLTEKKVSARELAESTLQRVRNLDENIKGYVTVTAEQALAQAQAVDEKIARGEEIAPLAGIPMAIKDNICTTGIKTTCSSKILANFVPPYDATVMQKLQAADGVLIGKTNLDEFAMGSSTENSAFFTTRNPWDLERVPGGSSGGSAAVVAAGEAVWALGSDTGGSIRQPAAYCGVVGLKPTYGRVSRYGLIAYASSLDQIGPLTKDVTDCAFVLKAISGHDPKDSTSVNSAAPDYTKALVNDVKGLRIGVPREFFVAGMDEEVRAAVMAGIEALVRQGAVAEEVSLPHTDYAMPAYYVIAPAEASSNLARYDGVSYGYRGEGDDIVAMYKRTRTEGFGAEVKRRILLGTYALSSGYYDAYYLKALKVRTLVKQDYDRAFEKYDVLITPTAPSAAFKIGEKSADPIELYLQDVCTIPINLAGIPGISLPCGYTRSGLPIGMQIIGQAFSEETLLRVAYTFEQNTDFRRKPSLKGV
ncbi:MAG TPA: Asp-tRNA(Asn)/Glu-tRNA(Gln) amidotransferase subunit GatA [Negativicutes bacterium]|nr:Asp-tRNA(Asn)/Glu-tRNA(Gln) amidotransferase subunit GatA [Negativicutes bacterium]